MRGLKYIFYVMMIFFAANILGIKCASAGVGGAVGRVVGRAVVGITTTALHNAGKFVVRTSASAVRGTSRFVVKTSVKTAYIAKKKVEDVIFDKFLDAATPDLKLADKVTENVSRVMNLAKTKIPDDVTESAEQAITFAKEKIPVDVTKNASRAMNFAKEKIPDEVTKNAERAINFVADSISDVTNDINFSDDKNLEVK